MGHQVRGACCRRTRLKATLEQLAARGPRDFYEGDTRAQHRRRHHRPPAARCRWKTSPPSARYHREPLPFPIAAARCLRRRSSPPARRWRIRCACCSRSWSPGRAPDATAYTEYALALQSAYRERLSDMGDADGRRALGAEHLAPACTTHFSVVDRDGNMAAVTQTLLSTFGSKFVTPQDRHHHEQRHHVVRSDAGRAELAGARQALPDQLHARGGGDLRRPAAWRSALPAAGASCRR